MKIFVILIKIITISMKKFWFFVGLGVITLLFVLWGISYLSYITEIRNVQDVVSKFIKAVSLRDKETLKDITGGRVFISIFSGDGRINEYYLDELSMYFSSYSEIKFFKVYRSSEFSQEEKRKYGVLGWKVNVIIINESAQYVSGYSFYVSKFSEVLEDNSIKTFYKVVDFIKVGEIAF